MMNIGACGLNCENCAAYNSGYYQAPRRVNVQSIADRVKVPRTTLQEHLNKAENKLISSIIPQIQLFARKNRARRSTLSA